MELQSQRKSARVITD